jgi:hypothetical protein
MLGGNTDGTEFEYNGKNWKYENGQFVSNNITEPPQGGPETIDGIGEKDANGFYVDSDGKISRSLIATQDNTKATFRVDPNYSQFKDEKGTKFNVEFNKGKYKLKTDKDVTSTMSSIAKKLLNEQVIPHAMFVYKDELYLVSDLKDESGGYRIFKVDPVNRVLSDKDDLVKAIKEKRTS